MQALWYLMLLHCIKSHPSMPIFNVLSQSFSVAEGCHKARWLSLGSSVHTVTLQKAFCVVPQGAHSTYSYIITSEWLQKSMECCYCRGHFPKALDNDNIPVQLPRTRLSKALKMCSAHDKSHPRFVLIQTVPRRTSCAPYGYWKCTTGSVCCVLWSPGENCQENQHGTNTFLYGIWYWR